MVAKKSIPVMTGSYRNIERIHGERNDCVVRAMTVITKEPYEKIHSILERNGRKFCKSTYNDAVFGAAKELGLTPVVNKFGCGPRCKIRDRISLGKFIKMFPVGSYYVQHSGHAFAVIDGCVCDSWGSQKGKNLMVNVAFRMEKEIPMNNIDGSILEYRGFSLVKVSRGVYTHKILPEGMCLRKSDMTSMIDKIYNRMVIFGGVASKKVPTVIMEDIQ